MPRLIDADELKMCIRTLAKDIARVNGGVDDVTMALKEAYDMVDEAPTIDAEPVRHGRWVREDDFASFIDVPWLCSECSGKILLSGLYTPVGHGFKYCPMCGAMMDTKDNNAPTNEPNKICPINGAPCNECVPGAYCAKMDGEEHECD